MTIVLAVTFGATIAALALIRWAFGDPADSPGPLSVHTRHLPNALDGDTDPMERAA